MVDLSGLADIARRGTAKNAWAPLTQSDLGTGTVLFFDQSLTATGWVILTNSPSTGCEVLSAGKFKDETAGLNGIEKDLTRGVSVFNHTRALIRSVQPHHIPDQNVVALVHESPPNPSAVVGGGTSSLMAAQSVRCAVEVEGGAISMLGAQPGKKLICGTTKVTKAEAHAVLKSTVLPWVHNSAAVTNEATRDALMGALLFLHRKGSQK